MGAVALNTVETGLPAEIGDIGAARAIELKNNRARRSLTNMASAGASVEERANAAASNICDALLHPQDDEARFGALTKIANLPASVQVRSEPGLSDALRIPALADAF